MSLRTAIAAVLVAGLSTPAAGQTAPAGPVPSSQAPLPGQIERVLLTAGRSTVLRTDFEVVRIAVTNPAVADAVVVQPREILVDGKSPGTVSLIVWSATDRKHYDLVVEPAITTLQQQLRALFPGEDVRVSATDEAIILSGAVSSNTVSLRAAEIAQASSSKVKVINMLQLPSGQESQQVMLQVRFAEVNRRALTELGSNFVVNRADYAGRSTTQQFSAPNFDEDRGGLVFADFLNLFFFNRQEGVGAIIKALQSRGFFQSLAEPNLIAYNGEEASFLAGGEIPIPVVQGGGGGSNSSVTVVFKEFGIRLNFRPVIAGDIIRLKVRPEVSTLDFGNGVTLQGFRIPALSTRRAETNVELRDGQSFAIAGLLDNLTQEDAAAIPVLSRIPILGNLFKSKADRAERTELMVLITPRLVRALEPDEVPPLPTLPRRFLPAPPVGGEKPGSKPGGSSGLVDAPAVVRDPKGGGSPKQ
ncbi:MAG TPA: type II and III secretion system protein family protein [Vicinamibacterales bacterium]|jgi:pilus assembly protein CpaC